MCVLVPQSCLTLCNPMDCSPPGYSVHGILQAGILEWVAIPFSRRSSWPRGWTLVFQIAGKFFTIWATSGPGASHTNFENSSLSVKWGGIRVGVLRESVQLFQRTEIWDSIKVRIGPQRETRLSPALSHSTLCPWLSLSRFLKLFELQVPHQKNGAYKMEHSELFWRNRK